MALHCSMFPFIESFILQIDRNTLFHFDYYYLKMRHTWYSIWYEQWTLNSERKASITSSRNNIREKSLGRNIIFKLTITLKAIHKLLLICLCFGRLIQKHYFKFFFTFYSFATYEWWFSLVHLRTVCAVQNFDRKNSNQTMGTICEEEHKKKRTRWNEDITSNYLILILTAAQACIHQKNFHCFNASVILCVFDLLANRSPYNSVQQRKPSKPLGRQIDGS